MRTSEEPSRSLLTRFPMQPPRAVSALPAWAHRSAEQFFDPPRSYTVVPMWFWNDAIDEQEIVRQMHDFSEHGVYGIVLHPRVGLPKDLGWLSPRMVELVRFTLEEARRSDLHVYLYDEGMYPSGSSAGQVVAENAGYAGRCLDYIHTERSEPPQLAADERMLAVVSRANGRRIAVFERPSGAVIRGLHFLDVSESTPEHLDAARDPPHTQPLYADLLNPDAVACFIRLVYGRFAAEFGEYLGITVPAIFTDEPRPWRGPGGVPGNAGIIEHVSRLLGYDFTPHLPALWFDDEPDAMRQRSAYLRAIRLRFNETYFAPLSRWCNEHRVALCGHPQWQDDLGSERYFQVPGQDIIGRELLPGDGSALRGRNSVLARCASSAMIHGRRRRCAAEILGAYGHRLTWEEMKWVTDWCLVRGVNLLFPHAFYYSYRGRRRDERPPDVGPRSPWWGAYRRYADYCRRLCWLNTDTRHVCSVAVLADECWVPWRAGRVLQEAQRDFNYLEVRRLLEEATVGSDGIHVAGMHYQVLVVDWLPPTAADGEVDGAEWNSVRAPGPIPPEALRALEQLASAGRLVEWRSDDTPSDVPGAVAAGTDAELLQYVERAAPVDLVALPPAAELRYRHVVKADADWYLISNEGLGPIAGDLTVAADGHRAWIDPFSRTVEEIDATRNPIRFSLAPYQTRVLLVHPG